MYHNLSKLSIILLVVFSAFTSCEGDDMQPDEDDTCILIFDSSGPSGQVQFVNELGVNIEINLDMTRNTVGLTAYPMPGECLAMGLNADKTWEFEVSKCSNTNGRSCDSPSSTKALSIVLTDGEIRKVNVDERFF